MENLDVTEADELQKKFQRDINCLLDDVSKFTLAPHFNLSIQDRNLRKNGLTNIKNGIFSSENKPQIIKIIFERGILKNLLKVLDDKVEKHRELALGLLQA